MNGSSATFVQSIRRKHINTKKMTTQNTTATHYVTTTMNTTWMGEVSDMREDYNYFHLFYGTEEECQTELDARNEE